MKGRNKNAGLYAIASWVGIFTSVTILLLFSTFFSSGVDPLYQLPKEAYMTIENPPFHDLLPTLMWIFSGLLVFFTMSAWWKGLWGRLSRIHYSVFTLAVIALMWMLNYWNLLS